MVVKRCRQALSVEQYNLHACFHFVTSLESPFADKRMNEVIL